MSLYQSWIELKQAEASAVKARREVEDMLIAQLKLGEAFEGTFNAEPEGYKVKVTARMTRSVDADALQELAAEAGLSDHLGRLFRWKPEINAAAWKAADPSITNQLLPAITTKPSRPSFSIEQE